MATNFPTGLDNFTNPTGTDYLNSPDHAGQHADKNDAVEALQAKVGINNSAVTSSLDYKVSLIHKESNTLFVGEGDNEYDTIAEAITYLGTLVTTDAHMIKIMGGTHEVADTITVNLTMPIMIVGTGTEHTYIRPAAGLLNKDMFVIQSATYFNRMAFLGTAAWQAGTTATFIRYSTSGQYSEVTDFVMQTCKTGIEITSSSEVFGFNFIMEDCSVSGVGVTAGSDTPAIDFEVGNFVNCAIGVNLVSGVAANVYLITLRFLNEAGQTGIIYTPATFGYEVFTIQSCEWNHTGTFYAGVDFALARDADIEMIANIGTESKSPHASVLVSNNTATTTVTTTGTYYKIQGINSKPRVIFDAAGTAGTYTISVGAQTTAAIAFNAADATIKAAIEALTNVTTVTVTTVVANKEWTIEFLTTNEGWVNMPVTYNIAGLTGPTTYDVIDSYYVCKYGITNNKMTFSSSHSNDAAVWVTGTVSAGGNNRTIYVGMRKNGTGHIIAPTPVRAAVAGSPYPFSVTLYTTDLQQNDYFELFLTSSTSGDVITLMDLNGYMESR